MGLDNPLSRITSNVDRYIETNVASFNEYHPYLVAAEKSGAAVLAVTGTELLFNGYYLLSVACYTGSVAINRLASAHHDSEWTERDRRVR